MCTPPVSQKLLGRFMREYDYSKGPVRRADDIYVATKLAPYPWRIGKGSMTGVSRANLRGSLQLTLTASLFARTQRNPTRLWGTRSSGLACPSWVWHSYTGRRRWVGRRRRTGRAWWRCISRAGQGGWVGRSQQSTTACVAPRLCLTRSGATAGPWASATAGHASCGRRTATSRAKGRRLR
jgi:hypothetical protein